MTGRWLDFWRWADTVRPSAAETIGSLKRLGIGRMAMVTGDNRDVADAVAEEIGMEDVYAELLPEEKVDIVDRLVRTGSVAMIGDGVNDAPAHGDVRSWHSDGGGRNGCCPGDSGRCAYVG